MTTKSDADAQAEMKTELDNMLERYCSCSTIAGFHYVTDRDQTLAGRILWTLVLLVLASLGIYLSAENYHQWKSEPVMTYLKTAGDILGSKHLRKLS